MAARSLWTGSITFGLVNIPVKLFVAVREKNIQFHMLHDQDNVRLQRKMVCPADGKEVHSEHVVKGYEVSPGEYVVVREEELEAAAPKKSHTIEIEDFADMEDIDPVYFDRPYYVLPQEQGAKPYRLLVEAMEKSKKVGIARFVMRNKEYLCALRTQEGALVLETMHFNDEVIPVDKVEGEEIVTQPAVEEKKGRATNLMAALEASLAKAKGASRAAVHAPSHGR